MLSAWFLGLPVFAESIIDISSRTSNGSAAKVDAFYDSLAAKAERNWILKHVYPLIFVTDNTPTTLPEADLEFDYYRGKVIGRITIYNLEVFPQDSTEPKHYLINLAEKAGNTIHINTRKWVSRENLMFRSGDLIKPEILHRNLRYLRNLSYISEAYIILQPSLDSEELVDVAVIIQDKFSISGNGKFFAFNKFQVKLDEHNFLGLGQQLRNTWHINPEHKKSIGWESTYSISNLGGSFFKGELQWKDLPGFTQKSARLNRPFLFPAKRLSGGVEASQTYIREPVDTCVTNSVSLGGWGAYSLRGSHKDASQYTYAALAVEKSWFLKRPEVDINLGKAWHEAVLGITSLAITRSNTIRLPYVYSFLDEEEIPVGYRAELLLGYELGEFRNRQFAGLRGAWGRILPHGGYFNLQGGVETFFTNTGTEQAVLWTEPVWIMPKYRFGNIAARSFCKAKLIIGDNRFDTETLLLSDNTNHRGSRDISGTNLVSVSLEQDLIMPGDILGFEIIIFSFADAAMLTNNLNSITKDNFIFTEGLGFRLRNSRLVWDSVELHIAYNQTKGDNKKLSLSLTTRLPLQLHDFEGRKPQPFAYR